jgi:hypothetical protein
MTKNRGAATLSLLIVFSICITVSCGDTSDYPENVESTLATAGDNRPVLEKVLDHFRHDPDTLKLQASYYLIGNMEDHSFATYSLKDTNGNQVEFDVADYDDYNQLLKSFSDLEDSLGTLDFERGDKIPDAENITADFLIRQIDYAFGAWRSKPWATKLSYPLFRDYVLPYRGSNEPLEPWREYFWEKYNGIEDQMTDPTDPVEAAALINDDVRSWFTFDPRYYYHPTDQGLSEMLQTGVGRCEDMTNVSIYALRANGIAVTSDYTPHWADAGNNHAWNAIVTPDGKAIPFMGAEANPGKYSLANKAAKVYRKSFAENPASLAFQEHKQQSVPRWLGGRSYVDVTADYFPVCDVTVGFERRIPDSVDIAYICVFNSGEWKAIHWARIESQKATFGDMAPGIVYLPALYLNEKIVPWGPAFILETDCSQHSLVPSSTDSITARLVSTTIRAQVASTDGIVGKRLTNGREYELYYWDDEWLSVGTGTATDQTLLIEDVPAGVLYWLIAVDGDRSERIFTIESGNQIWW